MGLGRSRQRGQSLVEVLIAMAVFSVGILGILPMFLYSTQQMRMQKDKEIVSQIIVDWFGRVDALKYEETTQPNINDLLAAVSYETFDPNSVADNNHPITIVGKHSTGLLYKVSVDVDDGDDDTNWEADDTSAGMPGVAFKRVTITVAWRSVLGPEYTTKVSKVRLEDAPAFTSSSGG
jgi:prepilin-type N-terminal cleavage/methylation domain-containing protein